jgi:hypothetical protein
MKSTELMVSFFSAAAIAGTVALGVPELGSDMDNKYGLEAHFDPATVEVVNAPVEKPRHEYGRIADRAAMRILAGVNVVIDNI